MNRQHLPRQAVILAAGLGSRFIPFADRPWQKSATTLMGQPLIIHTLAAVRKLGIKEIFVVHTPEDKALPKLLAGQEVRLVIQEKPQGMGDAILTVKDQLQTGRTLVINPQQINVAQHLAGLRQIKQTSDDVVLFTKPTATPEKYGVVSLAGQQVTKIVEKPTAPTGLSDQRILGIYLLTDKFLQTLHQTETEEYQLEKALNAFAQTDRVLAVTSQASACSLKYVWDLFSVSQVMFEQFASKPVIHRSAQIHRTAIIEGPVVIEAGAQVYEYAIIKGPCYIGRNTVVGSYCKVRAEAVLEDGVQLQSHTEVKHCLVGEQTTLHSGFIGDSIIGEQTKIGAGLITANRRLDRQTVRVKIKGKLVDTGLATFGALIGDRVNIGIQSGTNPGTIIDSDSQILPGTILSAQK
jgi:bifunctional UDP-N-acetylglucosamine pyrophosphorylase/glucosamine-1-phosphate N-acetyltransferase